MSDRVMKRLRGGIVNLLLTFGGLLLGLVIIELLIPYYWEGQTSELYRLGEALEHDPTLGWVNKPGYSSIIKPPDTFWGRVEYFHNSKGLRDEEYTYEKPDDVYRILMFGDSFTFGWGVRQSETCADRLEAALKEQGSFQVINMGVVAYSTTQEVLYYKVEGYKYQPDLVMLMFYHNDLPDHVTRVSHPSPAFNLVDGKLVLYNVPYPPPPSSENISSSRKQTNLGKRFRQHIQLRWIRYLIEGVLARINPQHLEPFIPPDHWESGWKIMQVVLKQMKEDVEKQGSKLVVVTVPSTYRYAGYSSSSPESEIMNSLCTKEGIAHIDLQPGFSQSAFYPYFRFNDHWNAGGHRLAAQIIYDELLEANFEPQPTFKAVGAVFEYQLTLLGCAYGGSVSNFVDHQAPSGEKAWVALRWQGKDLQEDYRISIRLADERGHVVGQMDKLLIDDQDRPTSTWAEGVMVTDYCLLPVWPATPPGEYSLRLVVYSSATLEPLTVREGGNGLGVELGTLQVGRAMRNPALETLEIESPLGADMKEVRLLGYTLSTSGPPQPGEKVALHLYWQAKRDVKRDYGLLLHLRDEAGGFVLVGGVRRLTGDAYPTTKWRKGEILHSWYDFALPADIFPGVYRLVAEMMDMVTGQSLKEIDLGDQRVEDRPRRFEVPFIQHPLEANLGDKVEFLGYDLGPAPLTAGETLFLTLYWQAQDGIETSYKVFTHLLGEDNHIWGQKDNVPGQRALPTTGWVKGEVIVDEYEIIIHQGTPDGKYRLKIGMYDPLTGERLPVIGEKGKIEGDGVVLDKVQIGP